MATLTLPKVAELASGLLARGSDVLANDQAIQTFLNGSNIDQTNLNQAMTPTWTAQHIFSDGLRITANKKLSFGADNNTYWIEETPDEMKAYASGINVFRLVSSLVDAKVDFTVQPGKKYFFEGGGADNTYMYADTADNILMVVGGNDGMRLNASGNPFFGNHSTTASAANAFLDSATGQLQRSTSSIKYKERVEDLELDSSKIFSLRPVSYDDKKDKKRYFGLIAEEVNTILPDLVGKNSATGDCEYVFYDRLSVLLLSEVSKLRDSVAKLLKEKSARKKKDAPRNP